MAEPKTKRAPAKRGTVRTEHHITELPPGKTLEIDYLGTAPQISVLGVDRVEGAGIAGQDNFVNRWRYVLTWTD